MKRIIDIESAENIEKDEKVSYSPSIITAAEIALAKQLSTIASSATRGQGVARMAIKGIKILIEEGNHAAVASCLKRFKNIEINALDADECDELEDKYASSADSYETETEGEMLKIVDEESGSEDELSDNDFDVEDEVESVDGLDEFTEEDSGNDADDEDESDSGETDDTNE